MGCLSWGMTTFSFGAVHCYKLSVCVSIFAVIVPFAMSLTFKSLGINTDRVIYCFVTLSNVFLGSVTCLVHEVILFALFSFLLMCQFLVFASFAVPKIWGYSGQASRNTFPFPSPRLCSSLGMDNNGMVRLSEVGGKFEGSQSQLFTTLGVMKLSLQYLVNSKEKKTKWSSLFDWEPILRHTN